MAIAGYEIESAPQAYARAAGALYLGNIVLGIVSQVAQGAVIVSGNAAATAINLTSKEPLWRLGIVAEFVALVCATVLAAIYYLLLRPVSRELNLLATFIRLVAIAVEAVVALNLVTALLLLGGASSLRAFTPTQLYALANLALRSYDHGFGLALLLFGCCFLVHGQLIVRSEFLPRALGRLIQVAGVCYITNSTALFLTPRIADRLFPGILLPAFVAEASLCLWLLIKGVDADEWRRANLRASR